MPIGVQTVAVTADETGMRVDRFLEARFPGLSFSHIQRIIRKGELRVNGKRVQPKDRLAADAKVRIPPRQLDAPKPARADAALAKTFRSRSARKIYWALVAGVPKPRQGRISTFLAKEELERESRMRIARHGEEGASHAVTYYAVVETAARQLAWLSLKPVTG